MKGFNVLLVFFVFSSFALPYHFISLPYIFISPLPSTLISFLLFPFIFLYFCLFLFTLSYYKFVTIFSILCIVFPQKKGSLSLSLSKFFGGLFYFIFLASLLYVDNFLYSLKLYLFIYFRYQLIINLYN